jgi:hypothetical protein
MPSPPVPVVSSRSEEICTVRLGYGAMQIPGSESVGEPRDHGEVIRVLRLRTNARVRLRNIDGAPTLTWIDLTEGHVPDVDEQQFRIYADKAKAGCPARLAALAGIPEIVLTVKLVMPGSTPTDVSTHGATG